MAEELIIKKNASREDKYLSLIPQMEALVAGETDVIANLANITSALKHGMDFFWVGFYLVKNDELVLGPFQGQVACTRIAKGKGVCGTCMELKKTIIVPDVDRFPGHIACSSSSRSEIVVPVFSNRNELQLVLDIDSDQLNDFNETDQLHLEKIARIISSFIH